MAIHITRLNGGDITVGASSGGSTGHADTRFTLDGGTVETHNITGTLDLQWMIDNGYYDGENYDWSKTITQADIGNTVTSIGDETFGGCSGLTSVTIPNSVTSIGLYTFGGCNAALYDTTTIPGVKLVDGWAIGHTDSLSGNLNLIGIRGISASAFEDCIGLTSVTIPDSVVEIGESAFHYCSGLTSVTIPDSVTSIREYAFDSCTEITSVTIVATGKPGASAATVKQKMIDAGVDSSITWNMPS